MANKYLPEALYDIYVIDQCTELGTNIIEIEYDDNSTENSSVQDCFGYNMVCDHHYDEIMRSYYKKAKSVMGKSREKPQQTHQ